MDIIIILKDNTSPAYEVHVNHVILFELSHHHSWSLSINSTLSIAVQSDECNITCTVSLNSSWAIDSKHYQFNGRGWRRRFMRYALEVRFLPPARTTFQDESLVKMFGSKKKEKRLHPSKYVRPSPNIQVTSHVLCFRSPLLLLSSRPTISYTNGVFLSLFLSFTILHVL